MPAWALPAVATATIFAVMFHLGIAVTAEDYRAAWRSPWLMVKGLFASLIAVPIVAIAVARLFDLPRAAEVGMVVLAICPSAPIALRRALGAGAARSFAATLQVTAGILAAVTMPLTIAALNEVYGANAAVGSWPVARQVFLGQLLPLGLGMSLHYASPGTVAALQPRLAWIAKALVTALFVLTLLEVWRPVAGVGLRVGLAIAVAALCSVALGHLLGGPEASTRTALGISCGARNVGLALFVTAINDAPPEILAPMFAYLLISGAATMPYAAWRRRVDARARA